MPRRPSETGRRPRTGRAAERGDRPSRRSRTGGRSRDSRVAFSPAGRVPGGRIMERNRDHRDSMTNWRIQGSSVSPDVRRPANASRRRRYSRRYWRSRQIAGNHDAAGDAGGASLKAARIRRTRTPARRITLPHERLVVGGSAGPGRRPEARATRRCRRAHPVTAPRR